MRRFAFYLIGLAGTALLTAGVQPARNSSPVTAGLDVAHQPTTTPTAPPPDAGPFVLLDIDGRSVLTIELRAGRPDTGQYQFVNTSGGTYHGRASVDSRPNGQVRVRGLDPEGSYIPGIAGGVPQQSQLRLKGTFDPSDHRAVAKLWVAPTGQPLPCGALDTDDDDLEDQTGDTDPERDRCASPILRYRLWTGNPSYESAKRAAKKTSDLITDKDWSRLYEILPEAVRAGITPEAFASNMASQPYKRITRTTENGHGELKRSGGVSYFAQAYVLTAENADHTTSRFTTTFLFVFEAGEWRFASTTPPEPQP